MKNSGELLNQGRHSLTELNKTVNSPECVENQRLRLEAQQLTEKLWPRLVAMYGHKFTSQFGEHPDKTWSECLKGVTGRQMADGLNRCLSNYTEWPPGAAQFRSLCLGIIEDSEGNDSSWQHKSPAYMNIHDENYAMRESLCSTSGIEDAGAKEKKKQSGNEAMKGIKGMF